METQIENALDVLIARLQHLRELLEWRKVDALAHGRAPGGFRRNHRSDRDIATVHGSFISLALDIQATLDHPVHDRPPAQVGAWQRRLQQLVGECQELDLTEEFIKRSSVQE